MENKVESLHSNSNDTLNVAKQIKLVNQIGANERIVFSCKACKYYTCNKDQQRILVLTNAAIYNFQLKDNIFTALLSKIYNSNNSYQLHRKIPFKAIQSISIYKQQVNSQFIIHMIGECDEYYKYLICENTIQFHKKLNQLYKQNEGKYLQYYLLQKSTTNIIQFYTTKIQLKSKNIIRPKKQLKIILQQQNYTQIYTIKQLKYKLIYTNNIKQQQFQQQININNFNRCNINQINKYNINNNKYYISTCIPIIFINIEFIKQHNNQYTLIPSYIFKTETKYKLLTSLIICQSIWNQIQLKKPKYNQIIYLIAQMILILEYFHSRNFIYGQVRLESFYLKNDGYLVIDGMVSSITKLNQANLYDVYGNLQLASPQMLTCQGYRQQIDIWQLGICCYYLYYGYYPFKGKDILQLSKDIITKNIEIVQNDLLLDCIKRMLRKNKNERIKLKQLKQMQIFIQIDWQKLSKKEIELSYKPVINFDKIKQQNMQLIQSKY